MILPSARAFRLFGLVTLFFVAGWLVPALLWPGLGLDVLLVGLVVFDGLRARRHAFTFARSLPPTVYQGEPAPLAVRVENPGSQALHLRIREVLPAPLGDGAVELELRVPPGAVVEETVVRVPTARETVLLGTAAARVAGPLGLAWAERRVGDAQTVRIYPRIHHDGEAGRLIRAALERRDGSHVQPRAGPSTEVASLREYLPGDDYRSIAWKSTARRGKPVVGERAWEQRQRLAVLIDAGRPMSGADGSWTKLDHAMSAALALARVAVTWGDEVTIVLFSRALRKVVKTGGRTRDFATVFEALHREQADGHEPDWAALVGWCTEGLPRRSTAVLCTSIVDPGTTDRLAGALAALATRHRPLLVNLADPAIAAAARAVPEDPLAAFAQVTALGIEEGTRSLELRLRAVGVASVSVPADRLTLGMLRSWMEMTGRG